MSPTLMDRQQYGGYQTAPGGGAAVTQSQQRIPQMSEIDFSRKYRDNLLFPLPKTNVPHLKRIVN